MSFPRHALLYHKGEQKAKIGRVCQKPSVISPAKPLLTDLGEALLNRVEKYEELKKAPA